MRIPHSSHDGRRCAGGAAAPLARSAAVVVVGFGICRAVVEHVGRPLDVDASVAARDDVEVIPGGVVRLPGAPRGGLDMGYGPGQNIDFFVVRAAELGFQILMTGRRALPDATGHPFNMLAR